MAMSVVVEVLSAILIIFSECQVMSEYFEGEETL